MPATISLEERLARVDQIDLEPIVFKLVNPEPGEQGMSVEEADELTRLYRCFLKLNLMYPDKPIVPSRRLDPVWHTHILDTAKYRKDCDFIFGRPLEHFPYLGLRGKEDEKRWRERFAESCALFKQHFNVDIVADAGASACGDSGDSGGLCDGGACDSASCSSPDVSDRVRPRLNRELISA